MELIVAIAIASLIAGAVGTFSLAWQARTYASHNEAQLQNDFRYALNVIAHYLREARTITTSFSETRGQLTFFNANGIAFGQNTTLRTLWIKDSSLPMCSHVAKFEIDTSELPLVTLKLTSVDKLPGIKRGLPITITKQVRMRNFGK